jgi:hypothetical protein
MRRAAAILILVAAVSMLGASDVRGGTALVPAGKTVGTGLTATIVIDVTQGSSDKGQTAIRVQKAGATSAVIFDSGYVASINFLPGSCISSGYFDVTTSTVFRFRGWFIDGIVDDPLALQSLLGGFGDPSKATITNIDYVACTSVDYGAANGGVKWVLSFTAVIGFTK